MAKSFPAAGQPDIVLSAQKDAFYRKEMRQGFAQAADAVLGPYVSMAVQPELKLLAEMSYFFLTTMRGRQTLGEEYCDIFQVTEVGEKTKRFVLPGKWNRTLLLVFAVILPYVSKRVQQGGWKSLYTLFQPPQTARQRAEALRRQMLERHKQNANGNDISISGVNRGESYFSLLLSKKSWIPWILDWSNFFYRAHLAAFYLNGSYYDWSKRISGVRYAFTREPEAQRPNYKILGYFLVAQLAIESASSLRSVFRSIGKAWGVFHEPKEESSDSDQTQHNVMVVPSIPGMDDDEDEDTMEAGSIARDNKHRQGLEDVKCGICLCPTTDAACPPCGHMYCYEHIVEAVSVKKECPLCRRECNPNEIMCVYYTLS